MPPTNKAIYHCHIDSSVLEGYCACARLAAALECDSMFCRYRYMYIAANARFDVTACRLVFQQQTEEDDDQSRVFFSVTVYRTTSQAVVVEDFDDMRDFFPRAETKRDDRRAFEGPAASFASWKRKHLTNAKDTEQTENQ